MVLMSRLVPVRSFQRSEDCVVRLLLELEDCVDSGVWSVALGGASFPFCGTLGFGRVLWHEPERGGIQKERRCWLWWV